MRHHNSVPLPRRNIEFIALAGVALVAPFVFPEYKTQLAFLWVFILFALTWDLQGGQMGYNSFGNIVFFGLGMYVATAVQIGIAFDLGEWTKAGGENTFTHSTAQYFSGFVVGLIAAGSAPMILALLLGDSCWPCADNILPSARWDWASPPVKLLPVLMSSAPAVVCRCRYGRMKSAVFWCAITRFTLCVRHWR